MLGFDGDLPKRKLKIQVLTFLVGNRKKSAVKHSIEKPISF